MSETPNPSVAITTGRTKCKPIIGLAGVPGIGKTSFAARFPHPIVIQTEAGCYHLEVARFPKATCYQDIIDQITFLIKTPGHGFQTVVLDSADHLEPIIWSHTCKEGRKPSIEAFGYGKGYIEAMTHWREIISGLQKLRDMGLIVIVISHVQIKHYEDPTGEGYERYIPKLHKEAGAFLMESCDIWGFACWEVKAIDADGGDRKRGVGAGKRLLHLEERPAYLAKNRYGLPATIPLDYESFAAAYAEATKPTATK